MKPYIRTAVYLLVAIALVVTIWFQSRRISVLEKTNLELQARIDTYVKSQKSTRTISGGQQSEVPKLVAEIDSLRNSAASTWQERADVLRELAERLPEFGIPEMKLASENDWLDATKEPIETEADYRRALSRVRTAAIGRFAEEIRKALRRFTKENGGKFPSDPAELEKYLAKSIGADVWKRYEVVPAKAIPNMRLGSDSLLVLKAPIDYENDIKFVIGENGSGGIAFRGMELQNAIAPAIEAYKSANPGKEFTRLEELLPYATTPEQRNVIAKRIAELHD